MKTITQTKNTTNTVARVVGAALSSVPAKRAKLIAVGAIAAAGSALGQTLDFTDVSGNLVVQGAGGTIINSTLTLDTVGKSAEAILGDELFAKASFGDDFAQGSFSADAPDGQSVLALDTGFTVGEDTTVVVEWDFTDIDGTESVAFVVLLDATTGVTLFEQASGLVSTSGSEAFDLTGGGTYLWAFAGTVTRQNEGSAIASIRVLTDTKSADINGDGVLDLFDFLAFQTAFDAGDLAIADFDDDGSLTVFDFLAFQTAFDAG